MAQPDNMYGYETEHVYDTEDFREQSLEQQVHDVDDENDDINEDYVARLNNKYDNGYEEEEANEDEYIQEEFVSAYPLRGGSIKTRGNKLNQAAQTIYVTSVWIFVLIWSMLGIASFVASIMCFADSGLIEQKLLGFIFAVFMGPLHLLYLLGSKSYCPQLHTAVKKMMKMH